MKRITYMSYFWHFISVLSMIVAVISLKSGYEFRVEAVRLGHVVKPLWHLIYMVISIGIVYLIRVKLAVVVKPWCHRRIEAMYDKSVWDARKRKIDYIVGSLFWYSISNAIGIYLCYGSDAIPSIFMGTGGSGIDPIANWPES